VALETGFLLIYPNRGALNRVPRQQPGRSKDQPQMKSQLAGLHGDTSSSSSWQAVQLPAAKGEWVCGNNIPAS